MGAAEPSYGDGGTAYACGGKVSVGEAHIHIMAICADHGSRGDAVLMGDQSETRRRLERHGSMGLYLPKFHGLGESRA